MSRISPRDNQKSPRSAEPASAEQVTRKVDATPRKADPAKFERKTSPRRERMERDLRDSSHDKRPNRPSGKIAKP